jgi:hypothetical protein
MKFILYKMPENGNTVTALPGGHRFGHLAQI